MKYFVIVNHKTCGFFVQLVTDDLEHAESVKDAVIKADSLVINAYVAENKGV